MQWSARGLTGRDCRASACTLETRRPRTRLCSKICFRREAATSRRRPRLRRTPAGPNRASPAPIPSAGCSTARMRSIIWDTPRAGADQVGRAATRGSVGQCPSVLDFDRRHFVVTFPIDIHLRVNLTPTGMDVTNVLADKSPIRAEALQRWIVFQPRNEWRPPTAGGADADRVRVRLRRPGIYQPISPHPALYRGPAAGHPDQRPLPDRYLAAPGAMGVRVARHDEGPDPAARRAVCSTSGSKGPIPLPPCGWSRRPRRPSWKASWRRSPGSPRSSARHSRCSRTRASAGRQSCWSPRNEESALKYTRVLEWQAERDGIRFDMLGDDEANSPLGSEHGMRRVRSSPRWPPNPKSSMPRARTSNSSAPPACRPRKPRRASR